ncbi:hypothetical protein BCF74_12829 [Knoellia remsis]|uniref:Uncharacterized protein n=1 Tax=Knoellia remsis TaxID=407159 RepID=A0A2T0U675_9MICO|nr:hypothetical protein BCF74_12829 [Knoellia remsis]
MPGVLGEAEADGLPDADALGLDADVDPVGEGDFASSPPPLQPARASTPTVRTAAPRPHLEVTVAPTQ